MNKKLLIILGITLILAVVGVWIFLMVSGKNSQNGGIFATFNTEGETSENINNPDIFAENNSNVNEVTRPNRLHQLSFRPTAGAQFTENGLVYVEKGTGHVYHINLNTKNETLVSGTTFLQTNEATFSSTGQYVAITHQEGGLQRTVVGSVSAGGALEGVALPVGATEIVFSKDDTLNYLLRESAGSRGFEYDIKNASSRELFSIPLTDVRVVWGKDIYVYTTPSFGTRGNVYRVVDNSLKYVTGGSFSLFSQMSGDGLLLTSSNSTLVFSELVSRDDYIFGALLPEKCTFSEKINVCGIPNEISPSGFPDKWYQGVVSYEDNLWTVDTANGSMSRLSNLSYESGREIDIAHIGIDQVGEKIYFVNKNDNMLWLFDTTVE